MRPLYVCAHVRGTPSGQRISSRNVAHAAPQTRPISERRFSFETDGRTDMTAGARSSFRREKETTIIIAREVVREARDYGSRGIPFAVVPSRACCCFPAEAEGERDLAGMHRREASRQKSLSLSLSVSVSPRLGLPCGIFSAGTKSEYRRQGADVVAEE